MSDLPPPIKDDFNPPSLNPLDTPGGRDFLRDLYAMLDYMKKVGQLSDIDLIQQVEEKVANQYRTISWEHCVLGELIRRFEKAKGIERPPEPDLTDEEIKEMEREEAEAAQLESETDQGLHQ